MSAMIKRISASFVVLATALLVDCPAFADGFRRFDLYDGKGGATCEYFNRDAQLKWKHRQGDWVDAAGALRGTVPFAVTRVDPGSNHASWDSTALVHAVVSESTGKQLTILLKPLDDTSVSRAYFASREAADARVHPHLLITDSDGRKHMVSPLADTMLQCSTARSLGASERLTVAGNSYAVLQFDLERFATMKVSRAEIEMTAVDSVDGSASIGIYKLDVPRRDAHSPKGDGIAATHPNDAQLQDDPDVIMATGFEESDWRSAWGPQTIRGTFDIVNGAIGGQFAPLFGRALRVTIPKGENLGLDLSFSFTERTGSDPEELYFRYYLRLSNDWAPSVDGGKLPGISGTYGISGWGGRKADGSNGWSMRGQFYRQPDDANPMHAFTTVGTYAYHADMQETWGDAWPWTNGSIGLLERNRWYCIEQYVRLNVPGSADGVLRAWIDGVLAFERTDIRYRDSASIKIEKVWMNIYHGGKATPASDLQLFLDNIVIARRYIGPLAPAR